MKSKDLPVYVQKDKIIDAVKKHQVVIVESPTGSGKTTQLPLILHEAGFSRNGMIGITQPRRIAAVSVCEYIAEQMNTNVPGLVGYKMRFEDKTDSSTAIKIMTDGILLQEIKTDYTLSKYNVIIIDEAHERSLNIDFILGFLKQIVGKREDFRVVISSATINSEVFSEYFDGCPIIHIETEIFPVQIIYDPPRKEERYDGILKKIVEIIIRIVDERRKGGVLVFLPGEKNIKDCISLLNSSPVSRKLFILPLYGRLSKEEQEKVFIPAPMFKTKIVVATNIAETSITIDNISTVIDSGLAKVNYYNPRTFTSSLIENPISKASGNQRKGRAGRTGPGICYRLYSRGDADNRPLFSTEEIYRTDLSEVVLRMAEIGIRNFQSFNFISPPGRQGLVGAVDTLNLLGALTDSNELSSNGIMMVKFPLLPRLSRMIVESVYSYPDVLEETVIAASFLSTNAPFLLPSGEEMKARKAHHNFRDPAGDFVSYLRLFREFTSTQKKESFCKQYYLDIKTMTEITSIKQQLEDILGESGIPILSGGGVKDYLCSISKGLIQFVCVHTGRGVYKSLTTKRIFIHPGSVMFQETPAFIVAGEIVKTSRMFARSVSSLKKEWLSTISKSLAENLIIQGTPGKKKTGKKSEKRNTTWQIILGHETFDLIPYKKKKKLAVLPFGKIKSVLKLHKYNTLRTYKGLRGKVVYKNHELLFGERLKDILRIVEIIDIDSDLMDRRLPESNFTSGKDLDKLSPNLSSLLKLFRGKKNSRTLYFSCFETDNNGNYWFSYMKNFFTALSNSLGTLETLSDEIGGDIDQNIQDAINRTYRRLTEYLESL